MGVQGLFPSGFVVSCECGNPVASPFDKLDSTPCRRDYSQEIRLLLSQPQKACNEEKSERESLADLLRTLLVRVRLGRHGFPGRGRSQFSFGFRNQIAEIVSTSRTHTGRGFLDHQPALDDFFGHPPQYRPCA
jgi:hypothetical protein